MRELAEAREAFNALMQDYTAVIVQTERKPLQFSDDFFMQNGLAVPRKKVPYTAPAFVGARYHPDFVARYRKGKNPPLNIRPEIIPEVDGDEKYLICDDYCSHGDTLEIAMLRLLERGVDFDRIWCIAQRTVGGAEGKELWYLDRGREWHAYRKSEEGWRRLILKSQGFEFPSIDKFFESQGTHPAIIDEELFKRVQEKLN